MSNLRPHTNEHRSRRSGGDHFTFTQAAVRVGQSGILAGVVCGINQRTTASSSSGGSSKARVPLRSMEEPPSSVVRRDPRISRERSLRIPAPPKTQVRQTHTTKDVTHVRSSGSRYESRETKAVRSSGSRYESRETKAVTSSGSRYESRETKAVTHERSSGSRYESRETIHRTSYYKT